MYNMIQGQGMQMMNAPNTNQMNLPPQQQPYQFCSNPQQQVMMYPTEGQPITANQQQVNQTCENLDNPQNNPQFNYTSYENLPNYPADCNLQAVVQQIETYFADKKDWKKQFDAIDNLRVFNKYYPTEINNLFQKFGMNVVENIEGVKTCNLRNSIMFIGEVFISAKNVKLLDEIIFKFVPILLKRSLTELKLISEQAKLGLSEFVTNCASWNCSYNVICQCCFDKSPQICEQAMKILAKLIQFGEAQFMKLSPETLQIIMKTLTQILDGKRQNMQQWALQICHFISNITGQENYMNLIQNVLTNDECRKMINQLQAIQTNNMKKESKSKNCTTSALKSHKKMSMNFANQQRQAQLAAQQFPQQQQQFDQQIMGDQIYYQNNQLNTNSMMPDNNFVNNNFMPQQNTNINYNNGNFISTNNM